MFDNLENALKIHCSNGRAKRIRRRWNQLLMPDGCSKHPAVASSSRSSQMSEAVYGESPLRLAVLQSGLSHSRSSGFSSCRSFKT